MIASESNALPVLSAFEGTLSKGRYALTRYQVNRRVAASTMYHVYILCCSDDSFYIGQSQNVRERLQVHQSGNGPAFTAARLPVELAYHEKYATPEAAVRCERQLKSWTRAKKQTLIAENAQKLKELSRVR